MKMSGNLCIKKNQKLYLDDQFAIKKSLEQIMLLIKKKKKNVSPLKRF